MYNFKKHAAIVFFSIAILSFAQQNQDFTQFVNPFIGTGGHGHTYPGPTYPFGMVQLSPDNKSHSSEWDWCSGYHYSDSIIVGFSHTHLSGTGVADLGDILLMPFMGSNPFPNTSNKAYASTFSHQNEKASIGYYSVFLDKPKAKAELTTSHRVGFHQYSFQKNDSTALIIDLNHKIYFGNPKDCYLKLVNDSTIIGQKNMLNGWAPMRKVFFVIKLSKPVKNATYYNEEWDKSIKLAYNTSYVRGDATKAALYFDLKSTEPLKVKVAISMVSLENAHQNIKEISSWNFDNQVQESKRVWNKELSKIKIEGTTEQKQIFYTSLYHTMVSPNLLSDSDGSYTGADYATHQSKSNDFYSTFSLWDTYRAANPLYTILVPERVKHMANSMLEHYNQNHYLPIWTLWGTENHCMIGNHAIPVLADAYFKGLMSEKQGRNAYQAMKVSVTINHPTSEWESYIKNGYYHAEQWENLSKTLESCYDDWCVLQMAKKFGTEAEIKEFERRAGFYKNLFHPTRQLMYPKYESGKWKTSFNPAEVSDKWKDVTEGNSWQYTWSVQHDPQGLISLFGTKESFLKKLDSTFNESNKPIVHLPDVTGLIGQYAHGNEPSHHIAYMYNYANKPKKTQELVRKICQTQYKNTPDGISGNEDCGQMSAWYIFNALGMYPLNPANGKYDLSAPQVPYAEISLENGSVFKITAKNISDKNKYVKKTTLNGKPLLDLFITHQQILNGGELVFEMTDK